MSDDDMPTLKEVRDHIITVPPDELRIGDLLLISDPIVRLDASGIIYTSERCLHLAHRKQVLIIRTQPNERGEDAHE